MKFKIVYNLEIFDNITDAQLHSSVIGFIYIIHLASRIDILFGKRVIINH